MIGPGSNKKCDWILVKFDLLKCLFDGAGSKVKSISSQVDKLIVIQVGCKSPVTLSPLRKTKTFSFLRARLPQWLATASKPSDGKTLRPQQLWQPAPKTTSVYCAHNHV